MPSGMFWELTVNTVQSQEIQKSLRIQLNHMGTIVLPRTIIDKGESEFNLEPAKEKTSS